MYANVNLFIDGAWTAAKSGKTLDVLNPAVGALASSIAVTSSVVVVFAGDQVPHCGRVLGIGK